LCGFWDSVRFTLAAFKGLHLLIMHPVRYARQMKTMTTGCFEKLLVLIKGAQTDAAIIARCVSAVDKILGSL